MRSTSAPTRPDVPPAVMPSVKAWRMRCLKSGRGCRAMTAARSRLVDVVVADAQDVVLHARGHQRDLRLHELGDARGGVQGDGGPHPSDAVLRYWWACRKRRASSALSTSKRRPLRVEGFVQAEVVEHRADVEQLGVEAESRLRPCRLPKQYTRREWS